MASDQGPVVTEASLQPSQHPPAAAPVPQSSVTDAPEPGANANPLKRSRDDTITSPTPAVEEPLYKTPRFTLRSTSPIQLTAAAAAFEAERRRREEDLGHDQTNAIDVHSAIEKFVQNAEALRHGSTQPSVPAAPTAVMDPTAKLDAEPVAVLEQPAAAPEPPTSTLNSTSVAASTSILDATQPGDVSIADAQVTESPTPMDIDPKLEEAHAAQQENRAPPASLSYPGPQPTPTPMPTASLARTLSYPLTTASEQGSPTSPETGTKKHKCPFCDTVFTRHHNLKSHLLTHSQEKPYECEKCKMRFRRLHDLKRHSKLHTGEKPHVCPKCDRKFARGDALARHSKGVGGCAGRRSSMGSFAEDDMANSSLVDGDVSQLSVYTRYATEAAAIEEARRRQSLSIPKAPQGTAATIHTSPEAAIMHLRDYQPGPQRASSGLFPPASERNSVSTSTSLRLADIMGNGHIPATGISSLPVSAGKDGSICSPVRVTESLGPLSPAVPAPPGQDSLSTTPHHSRPSSLTYQSPQPLQQPPPQSYVQHDSDRRTPPIATTSVGAIAKANSTPDGRYVASQNGPGTPQSGSARASNGTQAIENPNMFAGDVYGLWTYIQSLEERIAQMEKTDHEKQVQITALTNDVAELRKELEARHAADPVVEKQQIGGVDAAAVPI